MIILSIQMPIFSYPLINPVTKILKKYVGYVTCLQINFENY